MKNQKIRTATRTISHSNRPTRLFKAAITVALMSPLVAMADPLTPVNLRSTAKFAILAGSKVSNVPESAVTGDIGLSPAAGTNITGFGLTEVTGTIYVVGPPGPAGSVTASSELTAAQGDLTLAYNDAAGRTPAPTGTYLNPGSGNLGGMTLVPGLYKFTGGAAITGSDLVLTGSATDVWIFQIASDLNVGNGIQITLAGGALAANVFWQVGTSATLGSTVKFKGTILADQSISLNTGATLDGRALASIAAVTIEGSTIKRPDPAPATIARASAAQGFSLFRNGDGSGAQSGMAFMVPSNGKTILKMVNSSGREVATLFNGEAMAGVPHQVEFNQAGLSKGLYLTRLEHNGEMLLSKSFLIR